MRARTGWLVATVAALLSACSAPEKPVVKQPPAEPVITQLYAPEPTIAAGETAKICYGVENATSVWISPPMHELSAAVARCVEVNPTAKTTYTLIVEGAGGKRVTRDIDIGIGAAKAKIVNVNISAVDVKAGDTVSICYTVANARAVTIDPPGYKGGAATKGCTTDQPRKPTTYVVTAIGAGGNRDEERVTVKVR